MLRKLWAPLSIITFAVLVWRHLLVQSLTYRNETAQINEAIRWFRASFLPWQNRYLTPRIQWFLHKFTGHDPVWSYKILVLLLVLTLTVVSLYVYRRLFKQWSSAVIATVLLFFSYCLIADIRVYTWDLMDMTVFSVFLLATQANNTLLAVGAYGIALLNRESALFMPLWYFIHCWKGPWRPLLLWGPLFLVGIGYIKWLRSFWELGTDVSANPMLLGNYFTLPEAIQQLKVDELTMTSLFFTIPAIILPIVFWKKRTLDLRFALWMEACICVTLLAAFVPEIRVYSFLLPALTYGLSSILFGRSIAHASQMDPKKESHRRSCYP